MCRESVILCTRSGRIIVFSKIVLGKRLWLEHVCKVCAQLALLLGFYGWFMLRGRFCTLRPLGGIWVVLYAVLPLAGKEIVRIPR